MKIFNGRNPFKNSLKLLVPRGSENVTRKSIFIAFNNLIGDQVRNIRGISPFKAGNNWIIYFDNAYDVSSLVDKSLKINDKSFTLISAECELDPYRYQSYRFHWLPWTSSEELEILKGYCKTLSKDIEIMSLQPEFCVENGMNNVFNGNYRLKIRFLETNKDNVKIETGPRVIDGMRTLLTRLGEKPKCLQCSSEEHLRRDCPLLKVVCKKCKQKGHVEEKCTMANRLKTNEVDDNQDLNKDDLEGEVASGNGKNEGEAMEVAAPSGSKGEEKIADLKGGSKARVEKIQATEKPPAPVTSTPLPKTAQKKKAISPLEKDAGKQGRLEESTEPYSDEEQTNEEDKDNSDDKTNENTISE